MSFAVDRMASCPQCGAPISFRFASAQAQVCAHCRFVIVRADGYLRSSGQVAELVTTTSPYRVGVSGSAFGKAFRIGGRVQYDRVNQASAPWQEQYIEWQNGEWAWLAQAQGRVYLTSLYPHPLHLPTYQQAAPGTPITIGAQTLYVAERASRRLVSGEGELPFMIKPGIVEWYADLSGPNGAFGTIDYGDGSAPPLLYLGHQIHPSEVRLDESFGPPVAAPRIETKALVCPGCGGNLPLASPEAERIVCVYCQLSSDVTEQGLVGISRLPKPPVEPQIPLGSRGNLHGLDLICIAYMIRSTVVDGDKYAWREYLLYAEGEGYLWLLEEDEKWQLSRPISPGDVSSGTPAGPSDLHRLAEGLVRQYRGNLYHHQQTVVATVDYVVGEMYWKVEVGETVHATEWKAGTERLSQERNDDEIVMSHAVEISRSEIQQAFASTQLRGYLNRKEYQRSKAWSVVIPALLVGWVTIGMSSLAAQSNQRVYNNYIYEPSPALTPDDHDIVVAGQICSVWRELVSKGAASLPLGCQPDDGLDRAHYTSYFDVEADKKNLRVRVHVPGLDNSWVYADIALIDDEHGHVYERGVEVQYYHGVDGGERWTEGSRTESAWFSRVPRGRYLLRIDPEWEPNRAFQTMLIDVRSDSPRWSYALWAFGAVVFIIAGCLYIDVKWQTREGSYYS